MIIGIDVDDVCIDLMNIWLKKYNYEFDDSLTRDKITDWDISQFVKPECGTKIYNYIEDRNIYDHAKPIKNSLEGITLLKQLGRVIFITAPTVGSAGRKYLWLKEYGYIDFLTDYIEAKDKSLIKYDYLIDDNYHNLENSNYGFLFTQPWNKKYSYPRRINNWQEFIDERDNDYNNWLCRFGKINN